MVDNQRERLFHVPSNLNNKNYEPLLPKCLKDLVGGPLNANFIGNKSDLKMFALL